MPPTRVRTRIVPVVSYIQAYRMLQLGYQNNLLV
jgi:hypothetical protein